ncbi:hypothetical protein QK421_06970, partial [Pseudomonas aeruginosa]|nr:hypothetical protein [Pseudomonas aeruginosa]
TFHAETSILKDYSLAHRNVPSPDAYGDIATGDFDGALSATADRCACRLLASQSNTEVISKGPKIRSSTRTGATRLPVRNH